MKNTRLFMVGISALVAAILLISGAFAGGGDPQPILRAVPVQSNWIADGTTQYSIMIVGDSTPMSGLGTRGIDFGYYLPVAEGYSFNLVNTTLRPSNDFFTGYNTIDIPDFGLVGRVMSASGMGPANRVGNMAELKFTVTQTNIWSSQNVQTSLQFDSHPSVTHFIRHNTQGGNIAPQLESLPFTVQPIFRGVSAHAAIACDEQSC